jgi:single-strand DNA-binding protein
MTINKVMLYGNLTRDPEVKQLPSGTSLIEFSLALNRRYKTSDGEQREEVSYVDVFAMGKVVDVLSEYLVAGKGIYVEGELKQDRWEKDGEKRSKLRVRLLEFQFGPKRDGGREGNDGEGQRGRSAHRAVVPAGARDAGDAGDGSFDDDVPF